MNIITKSFDKKRLAKESDVLAPDGSQVRLLTRLDRGSMAHFQLSPGQVTRAVVHQTVEELWFIIAGAGQMWRCVDGEERVDELEKGLSISIPIGTHFQFRNTGERALAAVAVTMPPWTNDDEALFVDGPWIATV